MQPILAPFTASISELKKNLTALLKQAEGEAIAILNHVTDCLFSTRRCI